MSAAQPIEVNSSPESGILILDEMPLSATSATRSMSRRERDSDIEVWHTPRDDSQSARSAGVGAGSVHSMESLRAVGSVTPVPTAREAEEPAAVVVDSSRPPHPNSLGLHTPPASTFAPSVASDHGEGMKSDTGIEAIPAPPATSTPAPEPEPALSNLSPLAEVEMELEAGPSQPTPTSSKRPRDETSSPSSRRRSGRVPYESRPDYARHYKYTQRRTDGGSESTGTVVKTKRQGNGKGKWKKKVKVEAETGPPIEPDDLVKVEGEGSFISKLSDKATESPAAPCWLDATEPPIEVRNSGSRGRGIYARRAFCPGDIVFSETPMLTTLPSDTEEQILDKLMRLPYHHMRAIWQLEASGGYQSLIKGLVDANSIPCADPDDPGEGAMGIFETLSRINHSCAPHAGWYWSTKQKRMRELQCPES
jgi:hypothetical protein